MRSKHYNTRPTLLLGEAWQEDVNSYHLKENLVLTKKNHFNAGINIVTAFQIKPKHDKI